MLKTILLGLMFCLGIGQAYAEDSAVQRLRTFLAKSGSMQADFSQVLVNEKGTPGQKSTGVFYLLRPGKFRWDYLKPYQQQIVSNGGKVWFYDMDLEQVTTKGLNDAIGSTPALLLTGDTALEKSFRIESEGNEEGLYWIKLVPKEEDSGFQYVTIGLDGETLAGMELHDNFGQLTRIYFSNVKMTARPAASLFEFKPPAGVDVFEEK